MSNPIVAKPSTTLIRKTSSRYLSGCLVVCLRVLLLQRLASLDSSTIHKNEEVGFGLIAKVNKVLLSLEDETLLVSNVRFCREMFFFNQSSGSYL